MKKNIKLVAKKIEQRTNCWACGESLAMAGLRYCPQCGTYNEIIFKEGDGNLQMITGHA